MSDKRYNQLGEEKSPYLLQHKDNPVHWFPWGDEAFETAREQQKPIMLSIGYSTCHWCHVMERDSFEDHGVADVLNQNFISIKVDREELPDVDQFYMNAVLAMHGQGGWPLTLFLDYDRRPFFGGTFFWREQFMSLLGAILESWNREPDKIAASGKQLVQFLNKNARSITASAGIDDASLAKAYTEFSNRFDSHYGGFGAAPKFPMPSSLALLLRIHRRSNAPSPLHMVTTTLDRMARGGLYDHLGGGFARYSTDEQWHVPHFEKMLYDNAQLITLYLSAFQVSGEKVFQKIARETIDYVLRDLTGPEGGFHSAQDADSDGEEGRYYVWGYDELHDAIPQEHFTLFREIYGVAEVGRFDKGMNILHLPLDVAWHRSEEPILKELRAKLFKQRGSRSEPAKDDKVLTSWNGLMLSALAKGWKVLGTDNYYQAAERAAQFIYDVLYNPADSTLLHRYRDGDSRVAGFLEDYAYLIQGLLDLYEAKFEPRWMEWATTLQATQDRLFWDERDGGYFMHLSEANGLPLRQKDFGDGATPSGNSVAMLNLLRLAAFHHDHDLRQRATRLMSIYKPKIEEQPTAYAAALCAYDFFLDETSEVAIISNDDHMADRIINTVHQHYLPNTVIALRRHNDSGYQPMILQDKALHHNKTTVYICRRGQCGLPDHELFPILEKLKSLKPLRLE